MAILELVVPKLHWTLVSFAVPTAIRHPYIAIQQLHRAEVVRDYDSGGSTTTTTATRPLFPTFYIFVAVTKSTDKPLWLVVIAVSNTPRFFLVDAVSRGTTRKVDFLEYC